MAKKRTSLDTILTPTFRSTGPQASADAALPEAHSSDGKRPTVKQQTVYLPRVVHEQLRHLAFEERAKMHDYLMEGLDLVFKSRGLPSVAELTELPAKGDE